MSKTNSYEYRERSAAQSNEFKKIAKDANALGLSKEYLLDLFVHACTKTTLFPPIVDKVIKQNFAEYHKKLANIMVNMENIDPIVFMQNYDEHYNSDTYSNAVENGTIFEQYLSAAGKDNRLIVINPNPFLVEEIGAIEDDALRNRFTLAFKDDRHVSLYKSFAQLKGIGICWFRDLRFFKDDNLRVIYFSRFKVDDYSKKQKQDSLLEDLKFIRKGLPNAKKWKLFCLMPTAMLESSESTESLRMQVMEQFSLEKIYLVDPKAVKVSVYNKLCMITLSYMPKIEDTEDLNNRLSKQNVTLQRCDLLEEETAQKAAGGSVSDELTSHSSGPEEACVPVRASLVDQGEYRICAKDLYCGSTTLIKTYDSIRMSDHTPRGRARAKEYNISNEIIINYSGKISDDGGSIVPLITYQGYVDRTKCVDYIAEKRKLHYQDKNKKYASEEQLEDHLESIVLDNPVLNKMIVQSIRTQYGMKPISLKTFCIVHIETLREKKICEDVYKKLFAGPKSGENPICSLLLGKITVEDIKDAVKKFTDACNFEEGEVDDLWRQLHTIFSLAIDQGYLKDNPVLEIIREMDEQDTEVKYFKKYMTEKTLTEAQEVALLKDLLTQEEQGFVVGILIKIFTGLTYSEICALTWGDYFKLKDYDCMLLNVNKWFGDKNTLVSQYLSNKKNRLVPLTKYIIPVLKEWKKRTDKLIKYYKIEGSVAESKPLVYRINDPLTAVTPDALRNFGNKLYKKHGPQGHTLGLADGQGGKKEYNTSSYAGDKFRENFYYQGLHEAGLDEGELCFLLGIHVLGGTFEENYAGYEKPSHLLKMRDKLDAWAVKRVGKLNCLDRKVTRFTLANKQRKFATESTVDPFEMEFKMKIKEDSTNIQLELFNRLGFDVYCEWE